MYVKPFMGQIPELTYLYTKYFGERIGFFVDAGAFDCYTWSNTWTLAKAGWKGIFIEPNPFAYERCEKHITGCDVEVIHVAVSDKPGKEMLRINGSVSTIEQGVIDGYMDIDGLAHTTDAPPEFIEVEVKTLNEILVDAAPHTLEVLSVDVEGSELKALRGFNISYWVPDMVIVECHEMCKKPLWARSVPINEYFANAGYVKIYCDHINNIYIKERMA